MVRKAEEIKFDRLIFHRIFLLWLWGKELEVISEGTGEGKQRDEERFVHTLIVGSFRECQYHSFYIASR